MPLWVISGLIGSATNFTCALIAGETGNELLLAAIEGFVGSFECVSLIFAAIDAVQMAVEVSSYSNSFAMGLLAGISTFAASGFFNGKYFSMLPGVNKMDDIAQVFFDATFGYSANVFNALTWDEVETYYESPSTTYVQTTYTTVSTPSSTPSIGGGAVRYAALY